MIGTGSKSSNWKFHFRAPIKMTTVLLSIF
jgi:hypothetical protein